MTGLSSSDGRVLVFDSGVGGLTVADEIRTKAPGLTVDYAQDTGFFPYGDKSDTALRQRLPAAARALCAAARPDVFVIACNTASTLALDEVRAALPIPVVGTVPAIKPAATATRTGVIGLLATPGTIGRAYTDRLIADFATEAHVIKHGTVDLVRLAERHAAGDPVSPEDIAAAQAPIFDAKRGEEVDTIVLACTHFPLVRDLLRQTAPREVAYIDSGEAIARQTLAVFKPTGSAPGRARAWTTGRVDPDSLTARALSRFGFPPPEVIEVAQTAPPDAAGLKGMTSPDVT